MDPEAPHDRPSSAPLAVPSSGSASAEAFRELAMALRTSVEAMHGVRELQGELVKTIQRQDRSEVVLQSTQALNDTFRGLATIQRELLTRLEKAGRPSGGAGRLIPLMLLGLLVVFLGGVFLVLDVLQQMRTQRTETAVSSVDVAEKTLVAYRDGKAEGAADAERSIEQLRAQNAQLEEREHALRLQIEEGDGEAADLQRQLRALETEREGLTSQIRTAQTEVLARRAVEEELRDVAMKLAVTEPRVRELEVENHAHRAENARLRKRLGQLAIGLPEAAAEPAPPRPAAAEGPPATVAATPSGERVDRDPALLGKIRDRLNQMLDVSSRGRGDMWQVTEVGGVTPERLDNVVFRRYDRRSGRLLEQLGAAEARIWIDRDRRSVDVEFAQGQVLRGGRSQPLPRESARKTVASGEMTRLWSQSGLLFLRFR